jgi:TatD DNase family protein
MAHLYVDSHCHLDDSAFDADREAVIARAGAAGVGNLLAIGGASGPDTLGSGLRLAERSAIRAAAEARPVVCSGEQAPAKPDSEPGIRIHAAGGIHPHEAAKAEEKHFDELRRLAGHPKFLAIGEIGLDYHYNYSPPEIQKRVLVRQLELARELMLPVIIHCRDAWADLREIVRTHWAHAEPDLAGNRGNPGGILHCFSGTREDAFELMGCGFMVSFAGNITFKKAEELRAVAGRIPLDRVLTETDCPYLAPTPYRGKRNEPAYVVEVTRQLAALHHVSPEEMGRHTVENFLRFFKLGSLD